MNEPINRLKKLCNCSIYFVLILLSLSCISQAKDLPLPRSEQGVKKVAGAILKCDFHELGSWGRKVFVGITLKDPESPYIRYNFPSADRAHYEQMCKDKVYVSIRYRAKRHELRPQISYWAQEIKKKKQPK